MKPVAWFVAAKIVALLALTAAIGGCDWLNKPAPCVANGTCNNPADYPPLNDDPIIIPSDAKKPKAAKSCYRMTMGCDDIQWDAKPDEHGALHGKCHQADSTPHMIPCDDVPKPDGGTDR